MPELLRAAVQLTEMQKAARKKKRADLVTDALHLHQMITTDEGCYNVRDLLWYDAVLAELHRRGYKLMNRPSIVKI